MAFDPENADAVVFLAAAQRSLAGEVRYAEAHQPNVVTNIGTVHHRNILIELK